MRWTRWAGVALLVLSACSSERAATVTFESGGRRATYAVEIARSPAEKSTGLMGRASLPRDHGMLFVWDDVKSHDFHMLRTLIPLDLISIRAGRVVAVQQMVPCPTTTNCPLTATPPIDAALEINAGEAKRAGIVPGALVDSDALS